MCLTVEERWTPGWVEQLQQQRRPRVDGYPTMESSSRDCVSVRDWDKTRISQLFFTQTPACCPLSWILTYLSLLLGCSGQCRPAIRVFQEFAVEDPQGNAAKTVLWRGLGHNNRPTSLSEALADTYSSRKMKTEKDFNPSYWNPRTVPSVVIAQSSSPLPHSWPNRIRVTAKFGELMLLHLRSSLPSLRAVVSKCL